VVLATAAVICCARHQQLRPSVEEGITEVRILASGRTCEPGWPQDTRLTATIKKEIPALVNALRDRGMAVDEPTFDPSQDDVMAATEPNAGRPLIVIYSGHGRWVDNKGDVLSPREHLAPPVRPVRSAFCVRGGPMAVEDIARRFRAPTPAVLLIADACFSAHVDLRGVQTDLSLLSGSTGYIKAEAVTPLTGRLTGILSEALDCDGDGQVSDFEIFAPLERGFNRLLPGQPNPKLHRQLRVAPAFFHSRRRQCSEAPPPLAAPAIEYFFAGRRHLYFEGRAAPDLSASVGGMPASAFAVPCSHRIGQCYDVGAPLPP